jgi:transposase
MVSLRRLFKRRQNDFEKALLAIHHEYGLKTRRGGEASFRRRAIAEARTVSAPELMDATEALLEAQSTLQRQVKAFERRIVEEARRDPICRRLVTAPGVGPLTAVTFRAAVDDPMRFRDSRSVGAHFGLTPRTIQSGKKDTRGKISKRGDRMVRAHLFMAAKSVVQMKRSSDLQTWGRQVAERRGIMKAYIAVARRLAVLLHRMWVTESDYRWGASAAN